MDGCDEVFISLCVSYFFVSFNNRSNSYNVYIQILIFVLSFYYMCMAIYKSKKKCVYDVYFLRLARATPATPLIPAAGTNNKAESGHKPMPVRGISVPVT